MVETPFEGIEGALEYVRLLSEALEEARDAIRHDIAEAAGATGLERRLQALRLVEYKLNQLGGHVDATSRILNDLRTLRRLLLGEREQSQEPDDWS